MLLPLQLIDVFKHGRSLGPPSSILHNAKTKKMLLAFAINTRAGTSGYEGLCGLAACRTGARLPLATQPPTDGDDTNMEQRIANIARRCNPDGIHLHSLGGWEDYEETIARPRRIDWAKPVQQDFHFERHSTLQVDAPERAHIGTGSSEELLERLISNQAPGETASAQSIPFVAVQQQCH